MNGANVDQTTKYGFTPLHYASLFEGWFYQSNCHYRIVKGLILVINNNGFFFPFILDHDEIMKCLLSWKAGVDIEGNNGWTPLFLAAIKGKHENSTNEKTKNVDYFMISYEIYD